MIVVNSSTRQFNIPGADLVFGVTADSGSEVKYFQCPRYVGNNVDLMACFIRINYRNANGEIDSHLIENVTVDGDNVTFAWELHPKVTMYKGNISFVMCVVGPDTKVKWHTTLGRGQVLEGLEPDWEPVIDETADVVAQLIAMVEAQTAAVEAEGGKQIKAVQAAAKTAQSDAVAQIEAKGVNVRESIPEDYTSLENTVDSLVRGRAGAIVCEVEGSAVVVNDASDMAIQGMRIFGRSTQDGTPTPDAPVEIKSVEKPVVRVCGKNLLPKIKSVNYAGITVTANEDGTALVNGTAEQQFTLSIGGRLPNIYGGYILSGTPVGSGKSDYCLTVGYFTDSGWLSEAYDTGAGVVIKGVDYAPYIGFSLLVRQGITVNNALFKPMLSNDGVEYEPYKDFQTVSLTHTLPGIPVTSGGNYTDSDGQQWICDEVDLERGVYVQRILHENPTLTKVDIEYDNTEAYSIRFSRAVLGGSTKLGLCSIVDRWVYGIGDTVHFYYDSDSTVGRIHVPKGTDITDADFVAILTTPIETPLSETEIAAYRAMHSNYPNTTILNDSGAHMIVKYAADTKLYIDNKIAALIGG